MREFLTVGGKLELASEMKETKTPEEQQNRFSEFLNVTATDIVIAAFTDVLAIFTWFLYRATANLAHIASQQEESTKTIERTYVFVNVKIARGIDHTPSGLLPSVFKSNFYNRGKTSAIITSDVDMIIISANRKILQEYYHLLMPPHELLSILLNKDRFYPFAQAQGFQIPKTFRADGLTDIDSIAREVGYPCIIKPPWRDKAWQTLYGNRKVIISHGAEELESNIRRLSAQFKNLTVQEVIQGDEQQIICSFAFLDERSKPLGIFTSKKVRQFPPHFGDSALVQSVCEPRVVELTARICKQLGLVGYVSIEFKKDPRDGEFNRFVRNSGF